MTMIQAVLESRLETDLWAESDLPVVLGSVGKDDLIANFRAQAEGPQKRFNSASGIKRGAHIIVPKILDAASEPGKRVVAGIETEIHEAALGGDEYTNRAGSLK